MITKFRIETASDIGDCTFNGTLTKDEYIDQLKQEFYDNFDAVNDFITEGHSSSSDMQANEYKSELETSYSSFTAKISNINNADMNENEIISNINDDNLFILIMTVYLDTIEDDAYEELSIWLDNSNRILSSNMDEDTKMTHLPEKSLEILVGNKYHILPNCKIIENYSSAGNIEFAMLILK